MKKLGLVGGLGPVSTLEYYNLINKRYRDIVKPESVAGENPEMIIYSLNLGVAYEMVSASDWTSLADYQMGAIEKCIAAGADFCAIAANTAHIVFEEMVKRSSVPLIGMIDETCKYAKKNGWNKVLVYGTKFTMQSGLYENTGKKYGVECIVPDEASQDIIQSIIFPNLEANIVDPVQKKQILSLSNELLSKLDVDALVLGCTELPLIIEEGDLKIPLIDAASCHIDAIVKYILT